MRTIPAPWTVNGDGCPTSQGLPIIQKANGHLLAVMADRNPANAALVASAPEMLEALALAHDWMTRHGALLRDMAPIARAIEKATAGAAA